MAFSSLSEFVAMGGYGFYVWLSYGLSVLSIIALVWFFRAQHQQLKQQIKQDIARQARIKAANREA